MTTRALPTRVLEVATARSTTAACYATLSTPVASRLTLLASVSGRTGARPSSVIIHVCTCSTSAARDAIHSAPIPDVLTLVAIVTVVSTAALPTRVLGVVAACSSVAASDGVVGAEVQTCLALVTRVSGVAGARPIRIVVDVRTSSTPVTRNSVRCTPVSNAFAVVSIVTTVTTSARVSSDPSYACASVATRDAVNATVVDHG